MSSDRISTETAVSARSSKNDGKSTQKKKEILPLGEINAPNPDSAMDAEREFTDPATDAGREKSDLPTDGRKEWAENVDFEPTRKYYEDLTKKSVDLDKRHDHTLLDGASKDNNTITIGVEKTDDMYKEIQEGRSFHLKPIHKSTTIKGRKPTLERRRRNSSRSPTIENSATPSPDRESRRYSRHHRSRSPRRRSRRSRSPRSRSPRSRSRSRSRYSRYHSSRSHRHYSRSPTPSSKRKEEDISLLNIREKKEVNVYKLNKGLEGHFRLYSNIYKNEKTLEDNILIEHPVPSNVKKARVLDPVVEALLKKKNGNNTITRDSSLVKAQDKVINVMGPFSKAWSLCEEAMQDQQRGKENIDIPVQTIVEHMRQSALLLGQAVVSLNHIRRFSVLTNLHSNKQAGTTLKAHQDLLELDRHELFGPEFRDEQAELRKEIMSLEKVYKEPPKQSFPLGPSHTSGTRVVRGGHNTSGNRGSRGGAPQRGGSRGKCSNSHTLRCYQGRVSCQMSPSNYQSSSTHGGSIQTSRSIKTVYPPMGKNNQRSGNPGIGKGMDHPIHIPSPTGEGDLKYPQRRERGSNKGDSISVGERGHTRNQAPRGTGPIEFVPKGKEGRVTTTHSEFKKLKPVCSIRTFQNGKFKGCEKHHRDERPNGKNRPEGRILHSSFKPRIQEICQVSMGGEALRVPLPLFRLRAGPKIVYKTSKGPSVNATAHKHKDHYIPRRHVAVRGVHGGDHNSKGLNNLPVRKSGVCNKLPKVGVTTHSEHRVFRGSDKQCDNDHVTHRRENKIPLRRMSGGHGDGLSSITEAYQSSRETNCYSISSHTMYVAGETFTTSANTGIKKKCQLQQPRDHRQTCQSRTDMVDRELRAHPREAHQNNPSRFNHSFRRGDRHIQCRGRLEGRVQGCRNRGSIHGRGNESTHKQSGNDCSRLGYSNI